jgi:DNA sulfur modification protein DndE
VKLKYKIYLSRDVSSKLGILAGRTGMIPNLLCRVGFCMSLGEPSMPNLALYVADKEGKEFNRYTLTGDYDLLFMALLRQRCVKDGLDLEADFEDQFVAHLSRGIILLYDRVKNLRELLKRVLEPVAAAGFTNSSEVVANSNESDLLYDEKKEW